MKSTAVSKSALTLLCAAQFVVVLDTTIVAVALPAIREDLGFSVAGLQWVLTAYTLTFGGFLMLLGRLNSAPSRALVSRLQFVTIPLTARPILPSLVSTARVVRSRLRRSAIRRSSARMPRASR